MNYKEYKTIDKSDWAHGAWQNEPDKMQFQDEETGFPCLINRGNSGALCGYVGIPESHPLYKKGYDEADIDVHGGLTFSDVCQPSEDESTGICHLPGEGEPDHVWWLGFDCAHSGDICPKYDREFRYGSYKTIGYVKNQIKNLAKQLKDIQDEKKDIKESV